MGFSNGIKKDTKKCIIIDYLNRKRCLPVDEILDREKVVIKPKDELLEKLHGINGVSVIGSGNIAYLLNLDII